MIRATLPWRSNDSTKDINSLTAQIIDRCVTDGGTLTLSSTAMQVTLGAFIAHGQDGMRSTSDANEVLTLPAPPSSGTDVYHVVLYARHRVGDAPIQQLTILDNATYTTSVDRAYFISFGKLSIPTGTTVGTGCTIDLSTSDLSDKLGKGTWRPPVANVAALPASTAVATNRTGETRIVLSDPAGVTSIYTWNGSAWVPSGGGAALMAHLSVKEFADAELLRNTERSGLVASDIGVSDYKSGPYFFDVFQHAGFVTTTTCNVRALKAILNGHYVETKAQPVTVLAPPGGPDRYDLVYLVVTRTTLGNPDVNLRPTFPSPNTLTRVQVDALAGLVTAPNSLPVANQNYDLLNQEIPLSTPNAYAQINASIVYADSVDPSFWLTTYSNGFGVAQTAVLNGVTYTLQGALEKGDPFLFTAPDGATVDGIRYMIPLFVLRRMSTETYLERSTPSGIRVVYPIHPNTRSAQAAMLALQAPYLDGDTATKVGRVSQLSGVIQGIDRPLSSAANALAIPSTMFRLNGELITTDADTGGGGTPTAGAPLPPTASLTGTTSADVAYDLVYLRMIRTRFPQIGLSPSGTVESQTSPVATLYASQSLPGPVFGPGVQLSSYPDNRVGEGAWVQAQFVSTRLTTPVNPVSLLEELLASAEVGMVKTGGFNAENTYGTAGLDPAQWLRPMEILDPRCPMDVASSGPFTLSRVLPIALIRRRNPGTFSNNNLNGTLGRPDGKSIDLGVIYPDEILDLRSRVVEDSSELDGILTTTMDQLVRGTLQTQFSAHPLAPALFAGKHLMLARIGGGGVGYDQFAPPDNYRGIWSAANDAYPVCQIFSPAASGTAGIITWSNAGAASLTVRAPLRSYLLTANNPLAGGVGELRPRWSTGPWFQQYFRPSSSVADNGALFPDVSLGRSQVLGDIYSPTLLCVSPQMPGQVVLDYQDNAISGGTPNWHQYANISVFEPFYDGVIRNWTVVNNDGTGAFTGHPIEMNKTGLAYGTTWIPTQAYLTNTGQPLCVASYWCVWPQPNYADDEHAIRYNVNKGFLLEPETVHAATLTVGAITAAVAIGMPFSDVEVTLPGLLTAGTSLAISQGMIFAGLPSGVFTGATGAALYGIADVQATEVATAGPVTPATVNIAANGLSGSVTFSATYAAGTVLRIRCMVRPVNPGNPWDWVWWIEVNRANRSVRGLFRFGLADCKVGATTSLGVRRITTFMSPLGASPLAPTAGLTSLVVPLRDVGAPNALSLIEYNRTGGNGGIFGTAGIGAYGTVGMFFRPTSTPLGDFVTGVGYPSTLGVPVATNGAGITNLMSPLVDVVFGGVVDTLITAQDILFVGVVQDMLNTACILDLSYTASAYQGIVTGNPALTDPPIVGLKRRALGKVMAVGQVHSTTAGSGLTTYLLSSAPRGSSAPVFTSGTMAAPAHVTGYEPLAILNNFPSFRYQQFAAFNTAAVRPDRAGLWPFPYDKGMLTNVVLRLPGGHRQVCLTNPAYYAGEETYGYQELSFTSTFGVPSGAGLTLRKQPNSDSPSDGSRPVAVGDVYAYPIGWSGSDITAYETAYFKKNSDSRGITLATTPVTLVGNELNPAFTSWLAPLNTANPYKAWATGNATKAGAMPQSFTMEADPGAPGRAYAQCFGVLVSPSSTDLSSSLQGRLHVLVGANSAMGADRATYQNATGEVVPAGNAFDVVIPVGRPVMTRR